MFTQLLKLENIQNFASDCGARAIISQFVTDQKKSIVKRSSSSDNGNVKCSEATIGIFNLNFELSFNKKAISRFNIIVFPIFYRSYYSYIIF